MMGNTQNPSVNGDWSDRAETLYGANAPYGVNMPNGMNAPYGVNMSNGMNAPYGVNQPYGMNAPYGGNVPYGVNMPNGTNAPYGANVPYGMNIPYENQNPAYGINPPYRVNQPYGSNPPYGVNQPYGSNPPYGVNQPYGSNPPYGVNQPYGSNPPYGVNQPYESNALYGMNPPYAPLPGYGENLSRNLPAVVADTRQQNLPVPYQTWYQIAPNKPQKAGNSPKAGADKLILLGIAGVLILSVIAIVIGIVLNNDGTERKASDIFASWVESFASDDENERTIDTPVMDFTTQSPETIRGEFCAVGEDGSLYVQTAYGVCRIKKRDLPYVFDYVYDGWAAELYDGLEIDSMAFYDGYLYIACGENGIYRVNPSRANTFTRVIEDNVGSFAIAGDSLFYVALEYKHSTYGSLYVAALNGKDQEPVGGPGITEGVQVRHAKKYTGSADFVYVDGYLYFFDEEDNLKRIDPDGNLRARMVVERERQKPSFESCGLYENGGILYLPSKGGGIYSYDIETDRLKKVSDAAVVADAPLVFAGNALLYYTENGVSGEEEAMWRQIINGEDTVYEGPQSFGPIYGERFVMQAVGEERLITFFMPRDMSREYYCTVCYENGEIIYEADTTFDYFTMPEVELTQEPQVILSEAEAGGRSSEIVYEAEDGSYRIFKADSASYSYDEENEEYAATGGQGLFCVYTDETGEHVECLVEGKVEQFSVMNGVLYYTVAETELSGEHYGFYRRNLSDGADAEAGWVGIVDDMGDPCISPEFNCYGGKIYYVRQVEGSPLYCYDPESGEDTPVGDISVGSCYTIWNNTIYFEDEEREALWKMNLDGTGLEQIDLPVDGGRLREIQVCPYQDSIYLAVVANRSDPDDPDMGYPELWVFAEDGSMELLVYEIESNFDLRQHLYYFDGQLYYSSNTSFRVRVLDLEAYFEGGGSLRNPYDTVFCEENFNTFFVTQRFVYMQLYLEEHLIRVYDRLTGEWVEDIDVGSLEER